MSETAMPLNADQAYEGLKHFLLRLVTDFHRRHGGDFDGLLAEANFHFVRAFQTYKPEKAQLITYVYHYIRNGLRNTLVRGGTSATVPTCGGRTFDSTRSPPARPLPASIASSGRSLMKHAKCSGWR